MQTGQSIPLLNYVILNVPEYQLVAQSWVSEEGNDGLYQIMQNSLNPEFKLVAQEWIFR